MNNEFQYANKIIDRENTSMFNNSKFAIFVTFELALDKGSS